MPVKNGAKFLSESIPNLLEMAEPDDEILVVDDNSSDNSPQLIKEYCRMDSRLNLVKNKETGLVGALNLGLKESQNEWVARCDVDDKYSINRLKAQREKISKNSVAIFSDYTFFSESIENLGRIPSALTAGLFS